MLLDSDSLDSSVSESELEAELDDDEEAEHDLSNGLNAYYMEGNGEISTAH